ncbi:NAD(P)H:quinone oxidoreductase, type IV (plasmid) [Sphingobium sp. LB126]|uniref:NAD(P)H:quinone oxidoreductase n=1 Tax=Sphingobium sp. LB126 TaxID=1983755 RepID=UPI000C20CEE8|nr:NAD(P)H:quinone oxidoreductase [Sphingobium sp. LB126]PJG45060.1 NAD(P)H:quinone oxidoreductase, type IV [Sphingobium sp. LB126]
MTKILILYYSMYGHISALARKVADGANSVDGVEVVIKRVPEIMERSALEQIGAAFEDDVPVASVDELSQYDAIIFGTPTRFGNMASQMRSFLDQTGQLWLAHGLVGKIGSVFTSTSTGSGNETTITSFHTTLLHHGMIICGVPYSVEALSDVSEPRGGSPLGAGYLCGADHRKPMTKAEVAIAEGQGRHVALIARKLHG